MQNKIKILCPAKINLTLKILNKRDDGFHNIESVMQAISLFDYLTVSIEKSDDLQIVLSGNSDEIPYDEKNLVYKAAKLFMETLNIKDTKIAVYIEKNIPVAAGLAGGSTDAAGMIFGLNYLFNNQLSECEINNLCAKLGSDLNFCLNGGKQIASGRGEILKQLPYEDFNVSLIKPLDLGISAKEAYSKFALKSKEEKNDSYVNDLEWAIIDGYKQLQFVKQNYPNSVMSGSGSTYYLINSEFLNHDGFWIKNNLKAISHGIKII